MADDDDWSDEDVRQKVAAPKVIGTCTKRRNARLMLVDIVHVVTALAQIV